MWRFNFSFPTMFYCRLYYLCFALTNFIFPSGRCFIYSFMVTCIFFFWCRLKIETSISLWMAPFFIPAGKFIALFVEIGLIGKKIIAWKDKFYIRNGVFNVPGASCYRATYDTDEAYSPFQVTFIKCVNKTPTQPPQPSAPFL